MAIHWVLSDMPDTADSVPTIFQQRTWETGGMSSGSCSPERLGDMPQVSQLAPGSSALSCCFSQYLR